MNIVRDNASEGEAMGLHFRSALLKDGWEDDVRLEIEAGRIARVTTGEQPRPGDEQHGIGLPGLPNLHSHAFQRAMAGLTQMRTHAMDDFWSWRETMYRFALAMTPDDVEAVATQLYVEMLEAGYTRVGEFHYLHHDPDGRPYAALAEMAERILAAAERSGIGLTLLPVFYAHATFGGTPPRTEQRRFVSDRGIYARLLEQTRGAAARVPGTIVGVAPHSLRAVTPEELTAVADLAGGDPIHIHVAEQKREVDDCMAWCGSPPVRWLLDHANVNERWCLVHATHMEPDETRRLAASGAVAGLCPLTEADLGDGTFDAVRFATAGGRFGIGSDSNVAIDGAAELRQLEYSQRLAIRTRNVLGRLGLSTGRALFEAALRGGDAALWAASGLEPGCAADIVALDDAHPSYPSLNRDRLMDVWVFSAGKALVQSVWVGGRKLVEHGSHCLRDAVAQRYRVAMKALIC
jgi:formimidoylglutamate deiminase